MTTTRIYDGMATSRARPGERSENWLPLPHACLPQAAGLPLRLEKSEDVVFPDGPLDVADDRTASVVEELNAHLGDATSPAGAAQNLGNLSKLDRIVIFRPPPRHGLWRKGP